ncbi:PP2C family protein-serine/threonine phosphatase [Streptomyces sp. NBC_01637]|uniref:PP2C family protein-serine/threonine phosphatase n=1 Tax=unclassified Streptomyces TaxID=2593676 RepID=UPI003868F149|nr:serine/threonine-protein phosphatase [Streptomyces sp. NBC_01653]WTC84489.1 serine/threonine-protein phosphatase [Streptomyces sp. NBC_01653]WTD86378.1 serine/threonine-protein phosphatase [Streptomyces sp. NBC_01637]WTD94146.1 serine/threonine-protein phosphatase [Streptomyces sp. NBC_01637]
MEEHERRPGKNVADPSEGSGERLLGLLLDRAHEMAPQLIAPMIAEEVAGIGGREVSILLQDYGRELLVPLPGLRLLVGEPQEIADSPAGTAFLRATPVEVRQADGVRMYLPLLDGSDEVGVLALTLDAVDDDDRRLLRRLASLVADILVTKHAYTDRFFQARRREPMSVAAEMQWSLLPPLTMSVPQVAVGGAVDPSYDIAGDSFDYALNDNLLHAAVIDAMGHALDAATMATVAIGAYRHARRAGIGLAEMYRYMDQAIAEQFGADHFVTAQMMNLDITTGLFQWVNAGHPVPLLIREKQVVRQLEGPITLPVGLGGACPSISHLQLQRGDRVLCYTDGVIEERDANGQPFGEEKLIGCVNRLEHGEGGMRAEALRLSQALKQERGGSTSDDATVFLIEWCGNPADHPAALQD